MRYEIKKTRMEMVFVLLLLAVFAGSILLVLMMGAASYGNLVERDEKSFTARTNVQYLATKIRHYDEIDSITIGSFSDRNDTTADDISTLYLRMELDGDYYYTKIYYYDGYIRELLCMENDELEPLDGAEIVAAKGLEFEQREDLLHYSIIGENGEKNEMMLQLRSNQGE